MDGAGLIEEHRRLGREADQHKREARRHRQAARAARERQAEIERRCRALGIKVIHQGEGDIHGRNEKAAAAS
ncbi:MAG: hypothetical protein K8H74_17870 [Notoacmeibacter sp.]|nr:hypothetical protein [Notoacmeibacter sp.]